MKNHLFDGLFANLNSSANLAFLPDGRYYTYEDALSVSARFANALQQLGVKFGDRVAVQVPKSIEAALLYIACVRIGAVFLPLNTAYTPTEIDYFLNDAGATLFICDPETLDQLTPIAEQNGANLQSMGVWSADAKSSGSFFDLAENLSHSLENAKCGPADLAAILYTSGTTGRSKGAMLSHDNLLSNAQTLKEVWRFTPDDVLLHALPIFHTHGLFVAINVTLVAGSSMIFQSGFNVDALIEALPKSTSMMGVPTYYTRLLNDSRFTKELVDHMRLFVSGSAPLLAETHVQFEKLTGQPILERYGMTETNMNTSNPYVGMRKAGTVGMALPGVEVRIANPETGAIVAKGDIGVLEVAGPNVFSGYWNIPEKTAEEFRPDGFFITGDLAQLDEDNYVKIVGRSKDLIISGGYNIYPKEIELLLDDEDGVLESAVVGVPHPDFGEGVVAVVVPSSDDFEPKQALKNLKTKLASFKQPKHLVIVDELPRNTMGKVQKKALRERFKDQFVGD